MRPLTLPRHHGLGVSGISPVQRTHERVGAEHHSSINGGHHKGRCPAFEVFVEHGRLLVKLTGGKGVIGGAKRVGIRHGSAHTGFFHGLFDSINDACDGPTEKPPRKDRTPILTLSQYSPKLGFDCC